MEAAKAEVPSVQEASERFNNMFSSHLSDFASLLSSIGTIEKDLRAMFDYMNEQHDCNNCPSRRSCDMFVEFCREEQLLRKAQRLMEFHFRILTLVPPCVKRKITDSLNSS